jgi:hypothetical protein
MPNIFYTETFYYLFQMIVSLKFRHNSPKDRVRSNLLDIVLCDGWIQTVELFLLWLSACENEKKKKYRVKIELVA